MPTVSGLCRVYVEVVKPVTALVEIPQLCSVEFLTCEQRSV